jgi:hypothetical protein
MSKSGKKGFRPIYLLAIAYVIVIYTILVSFGLIIKIIMH